MTDKKLTQQRVDVLGALGLAQSVIHGATTADRINAARLALAMAAQSRTFRCAFFSVSKE